MTRVERFGEAVLYLGDAREIVGDLAYDTVVTDPPYGTEDSEDGSRTGYGRQNLHSADGRLGLLILNDTDLSCCMATLKIIASRPSCRIALFHSPRNLAAFYDGLRLIGLDHTISHEAVWNKRMPSLGVGYFHYWHECITILSWGDPPSPSFDLESIVEETRNPKHHPHQKPDGLMGKLVSFVGGDTVLDPFMGSGSTGVACLNLRKRFIGIELDEAHFATACRRIEEASKQDGLFE